MPTQQSSLMLMERACARTWLEAFIVRQRLTGVGIDSKAEFDAAVDSLALHIFHYLQGFDETEG
jgi:hypothetical protein